MTDNTTSPSFESLKLLPGQALQLEFEGYDASRERSTLVGYLKGRGIIISTPTKQGVPVSIKPKSEVKVRLFVNQINGACAFASTIKHVSVLPFPHLHLSIPDKLFIGEVRKSIRATVHVISSIMFNVDGKRKALPSVIDDLSNNGARVHCKGLTAKEGDEIDLVFKITVSDIERMLHIKSIVRSVQINDAKETYVYGLQFTDVNEADKITLHAYVLTQIHLT